MGSTFYSKRLKRKYNTRKTRPKSFKTEEALKKHAESKGIKDYKIRNLRVEGAKDKKLIIV